MPLWWYKTILWYLPRFLRNSDFPRRGAKQEFGHSVWEPSLSWSVRLLLEWQSVTVTLLPIPKGVTLTAEDCIAIGEGKRLRMSDMKHSEFLHKIYVSPDVVTKALQSLRSSVTFLQWGWFHHWRMRLRPRYPCWAYLLAELESVSHKFNF